MFKVLKELTNGDFLVKNNGTSEIWSPDIMNLRAKEKIGKLVTCFTRNCGQRLVCGRLGSIASRMALDDNQATTIDGTHPGSGIVKSQGEVSHIQYYFTEQTAIEKWFMDRGLTKRGYMPGEDPNEPIDPSKLNFGEDEEISIERKKTRMEFEGQRKEVDFTQDQHFEEV